MKASTHILNPPGTATNSRVLPMRTTLFIVLVVVSSSLAASIRLRSAYATATNDAPSTSSTELVDATLRFDQSLYNVVLNNSFTADLVVDDASNLGGWEVTVVYDPTKLEITQVTSGGFLSSAGRTEASLQYSGDGPGYLSIGGYSYGPQSVPTGSGVLAHIVVRGIATGQTNLILQDALLASVESFGTVQPQPVTEEGAAVVVHLPLAVIMASIQATPQDHGVVVSWETISEIDNQGFNLKRSVTVDQPGSTRAFVPSQGPGSSQGFAYQWLDTDVAPGETYFYWLEAVDTSGATTLHGPVSVTFQAPTAVTVAGMQAAARSRAAAGWWVFAGGLALLFGVGLVVRRR